jgi:hypothetical protein
MRLNDVNATTGCVSGRSTREDAGWQRVKRRVRHAVQHQRRHDHAHDEELDHVHAGQVAGAERADGPVQRQPQQQQARDEAGDVDAASARPGLAGRGAEQPRVAEREQPMNTQTPGYACQAQVHGSPCAEHHHCMVSDPPAGRR